MSAPVAALVGLTLCDLVERTGRDPDLLALALADELRVGRVRCDFDGRFRLVVETIPPSVLAALAAIDVDDVSVERREAAAT